VKEFTPDQIRNIALIGHQDTGKNPARRGGTLRHRRHDPNGEDRRRNTMNGHRSGRDRAADIDHRGDGLGGDRNHKVNMLDTPGL